VIAGLTFMIVFKDIFAGKNDFPVLPAGAEK
jgi:hypothetical protein